MRNKFQIELIAWYDADSKDDWEFHDVLDKAENPTMCFTHGYILKEDKDWIWITHTVTAEAFAGRIRIPKKWIIRRKKTGTLKL